MRFRSGICAACGQESDRLRAWTHREMVGLHYTPRHTVRLTDVLLCPTCLAVALDEAEAASATPRRTIGVAGAVALVIGLVSVAGPPFWPAVFRWIRGPSPEETTAALQQAYGGPVVYKPPVLVPPTQGQDGR
jgi:hypothetical protein